MVGLYETPERQLSLPLLARRENESLRSESLGCSERMISEPLSNSFIFIAGPEPCYTYCPVFLSAQGSEGVKKYISSNNFSPAHRVVGIGKALGRNL